jgi:hypothetical protein
MGGTIAPVSLLDDLTVEKLPAVRVKIVHGLVEA